LGLTADIGRFVAGAARMSAPPAAIAIIRTGFTDCIAAMIASRDEPVTRLIAKFVQGDGHGGALRTSLFGADVSASAPDLALVFGTAAHAQDYDDTGLSGHPSAVLVPAVLAEAMETGADGRAMAMAYLAGYEVWADLIARDADSLHVKGWHPSAVMGTVAAAAVSASLRGLDAAQAAHAIGIAASMASGVVANFGSMTKPFHLGRAAQSGLLAARLAQSGMTASADAIEHPLGFLRALSPKLNADTTRPTHLGHEWRILTQGLNVKLYPVCYAVHRSLDAMIGLVEKKTFTPADIASIEVEIGVNQAAMLKNHRPQTGLEAKFSIEFAMAAAALAGRCGLAEVTDDFVRRPEVQDFFAKVITKPITELDPHDPTLSVYDQVHVNLRNNNTLSSERVAYPRGHFKRPAGPEALRQKFFDCAAGLGESLTRDLFDAAQQIDTLRSVDELPLISGKALA
jgi:2-methylcitrate dehydratase PrpD